MQQPSSFGRAPKPHVHRGLDSGQSFLLPEGVVGAIHTEAVYSQNGGK